MASSNPMSIRTLVEIAPILPTDTSILLRGAHGIGKSQLVRLIAHKIAALEKISDYEVIDRRLSQMTEGDMIGLPSITGDVTKFNPPDWYKRACLRPVVLLLDELNRATHEVMQAAFQVVLDRELNGWKLHPQTRVFAAVNASSEYTINEMDPALLDRFWVIDLTPDTADWLLWARDSDHIHPTIIEFIMSAEKWLDPPAHCEPGSINSSRRSWERVSKCLVATGLINDPSSPLFYAACLGYVGVEASIAFVSFAKTIDSQVSGKDIIDSYDKFRDRILRMSQDRLNACIEKASDHVTKNMKTLSDKQGRNLQSFMKDLPGELRVSCWSKLTAQGLERLDIARSVHKWCAATVLDVFGVPMGDAGVGVAPNIPGSLRSKSPSDRK